MSETLRIGVMVSDCGSNLQAIIDAIEKKELNAVIALVLSDKEKAPALDRAKRHHIPAEFLDPKKFSDRAHYEAEVVSKFKKPGVQWVVLAGYMKIVTSVLLSAYKDRIINIHPSLLPAFPGLRAQEQAFEHGVKVAGCTVHFVEEGVDSGPIIAQAAVPVLDDDTAETLKARILEEEHKIYPRVLQWISMDRVKLEGRKVTISMASGAPSGKRAKRS